MLTNAFTVDNTHRTQATYIEVARSQMKSASHAAPRNKMCEDKFSPFLPVAIDTLFCVIDCRMVACKTRIYLYLPIRHLVEIL